MAKNLIICGYFLWGIGNLYAQADPRIECFKAALEIKLPIPSSGPRPQMDSITAATLCSRIDSTVDSVTCFKDMMTVYANGEEFNKEAAANLCANTL